MEGNEQEGIELETINPDNDTIVFPDIEDIETDVDTSDNTEIETEVDGIENTDTKNSVNDEKESLQRGLNKERKLRKEAERKNKEFEAKLKALEEATNKESKKTTYDTLIESGIDEEVAKSVAKAIDNNKPDNSRLEKKIADLEFKNSLNTKSKEEGFEDILDYADEIKDLVDKGLTIEQSYYAVSYDKPNTNTKSEMERKFEAKMRNNTARKEILGNINSNTGVVQNTSNKVKLNATEKAVAAAAGMSAEEYAAVRDMDSVKDYNSYKSKKKQ